VALLWGYASIPFQLSADHSKQRRVMRLEAKLCYCIIFFIFEKSYKYAQAGYSRGRGIQQGTAVFGWYRSVSQYFGWWYEMVRNKQTGRLILYQQTEASPRGVFLQRIVKCIQWSKLNCEPMVDVMVKRERQVVGPLICNPNTRWRNSCSQWKDSYLGEASRPKGGRAYPRYRGIGI
jgi:hypothetical protein